MTDDVIFFNKVPSSIHSSLEIIKRLSSAEVGWKTVAYMLWQHLLRTRLPGESYIAAPAAGRCYERCTVNFRVKATLENFTIF